MRPIDADTLMPSFIKKACTMKDRHGVKLGEEWLLNYNDIKDVIDNAPTISVYTFKEVEEIRQATIEQVRISCKNERPQGEWIADEFGRKICGKCQFPFAEFQSGKYCSLCGADMRGKEE